MGGGWAGGGYRRRVPSYAPQGEMHQVSCPIASPQLQAHRCPPIPNITYSTCRENAQPWPSSLVDGSRECVNLNCSPPPKWFRRGFRRTLCLRRARRLSIDLVRVCFAARLLPSLLRERFSGVASTVPCHVLLTFPLSTVLPVPVAGEHPNRGARAGFPSRYARTHARPPGQICFCLHRPIFIAPSGSCPSVTRFLGATFVLVVPACARKPYQEEGRERSRVLRAPVSGATFLGPRALFITSRGG